MEGRYEMTARKLSIAAGVASAGLTAILTLGGPASVANANVAADQRTAGAVSTGPASSHSGFWYIQGYYPAKWVCEIDRTATATVYPTDGCYLEPSAGWYFWYYVA
jgi:hypothetical protein